MNVGGVTGYEHTPNAELSYLAVMDSEFATPMQNTRFYSTGRAFRQYLPHQVKRRNVSFRILD